MEAAAIIAAVLFGAAAVIAAWNWKGRFIHVDSHDHCEDYCDYSTQQTTAKEEWE